MNRIGKNYFIRFERPNKTPAVVPFEAARDQFVFNQISENHGIIFFLDLL